jgi:8-oxo-dGTP diphosphatase
MTTCDTPPDLAPTDRERHWYDVRQYAMVLNDDNQVLLLQLPEHYGKSCGGKWVLPGGKLRPDEGPGEGLLREITEETGLITELTEVLTVATWESPNSKKYGTFWLAQVTGGTLALSGEHQGYRWQPLTETPAAEELFLELLTEVWPLAISALGADDEE